MIWSVQVGKLLVTLASTGLNPESKPVCPEVDVDAKGLHGFAKEDCVTV